LENAGHYNQALQALDEFVGNRTPKPADRFERIALLASAGKMTQAQRLTQDRIREKPFALMPREALIMGLSRVKRYDDAISQLRQWLADLKSAGALANKDAAPVSQYCYRSLAAYLAIQHRPADAMKVIDEAIRDHCATPFLYTLQSNCLDELGRTQQAIQAATKAWKMDPNDPARANNLGYMCADAGVKLDAAEKLIRRALEKQPGQLNILDSLGWVLYKQGRFSEAGACFNRAIDEIADAGAPVSGAPVVLEHAADTYYRLGWKDRAKALWTQALRTARQAAHPVWDVRQVLRQVPKKLDALARHQPPPLAPLGDKPGANSAK